MGFWRIEWSIIFTMPVIGPRYQTNVLTLRFWVRAMVNDERTLRLSLRPDK